MKKIKHLVAEMTQELMKISEIFHPRLEAELLLSYCLKINRINLYLSWDTVISLDDLKRIQMIVEQRKQLVPLAYILQEQSFYRRTFFINSKVLIPRPETELLVKAVIQKLCFLNKKNDELQILDLGSGSGIIGISMALEIPRSRVTLVDISSDALEVARMNIKKYSIEDRVTLKQIDLNKTLDFNQSFDVILSNPPYLDVEDDLIDPWVRKYEPYEALFAPQKGRACLKTWLPLAYRHLNPQGIIGVEHGFNQGSFVQDIFSKLGLSSIESINDDQGFWRHTIGVKSFS